ncbi:hypothetical protein SALBM135S_06195 [Streptomyces alboniger]
MHREKWRLALGLLDTLAEWQLEAPVAVADAGYGVSTPFRLALEERGLPYVLALHGKEVAHPEDVEPHASPLMAGSGRPPLPATALRREPSPASRRRRVRSDSPK